MPELPISGTEIRARAARGEPVDGLVPLAVAAEIGRLGLYR
jgi:nicotinic acid mononucleotide adenylyltransferase